MRVGPGLTIAGPQAYTTSITHHSILYMKTNYVWWSLLFIGVVLFISLWWQPAPETSTDGVIGGDRDANGCLVAAGYAYDEVVKACVRSFELAPEQMEAARLAVAALGPEYALTVLSVEVNETPDSFTVQLERGVERVPEWVLLQDGVVVPLPDHESAEQTGLTFIQDVIAVAPPATDATAAERLYRSLSRSARADISVATIAGDMARFIGIQDVPDQGVSVEDLQIIGPTEAVLRVGLNYSGGRTQRDLHLIVEDQEWRIDRVSVVEEVL